MTVETQCPAERERSCRRCWQIRSLGTTQCHLHSSVSADFTLCPPLSFSLELQLDDTLLACLIASFVVILLFSIVRVSDWVHFILPQGQTANVRVTQTPSAWHASLRSFENHGGYTHWPLGFCHTGTQKNPTWVVVFWCWPPFDFQFLALCLKVELRTEGVFNILLPLPKWPIVKSRFHSVEVSIFYNRKIWLAIVVEL